MTILWIKSIKLKIIIVISCIIIAGIQGIIIYKNSKNDLLENYIQVNGIINNVLSSGNGIYTSTLLTVKYNYNGLEKTAAITRGGYEENYYKKGDTIIININKNDNNIIK
jgi:amino acid permease